MLPTRKRLPDEKGIETNSACSKCKYEAGLERDSPMRRGLKLTAGGVVPAGGVARKRLPDEKGIETGFFGSFELLYATRKRLPDEKGIETHCPHKRTQRFFHLERDSPMRRGLKLRIDGKGRCSGAFSKETPR